ncbi:tetratricopeptide repeat protein [Larkinella insperata]|uniref:Tetratricopeptide repeat protein n=1 Tax=Larkinella insperata TaxID=332158 RepID=A0ABW3QN77_9BACT
MSKPVRLIIFCLLLLQALPTCRVLARTTPVAGIVDEEYDRYKKRGDDFFKEGKYQDARRQYQNCLEVPGFENDAYAKKRIEECLTGLTLRQRAEEAARQGQNSQAVDLLHELLHLNPDDAITIGQLADHYEREGNKLFNQKRYPEARQNYTAAIQFANATKKETLQIQIRTIDDLVKPRYSKRIGLKVATGVIAIGVGAFALVLRNDYQSKISALNQISQKADPNGTGVIDNPDLYRQYDDAYKAAETAKQKNGLFTACVGVAAVATLAEVYLLVRKPKPRSTAFRCQPASQSWGLAVRYSF